MVATGAPQRKKGSMQNLIQNLHFSIRMLCKNPGLTITILLTLALGIGANTAIFTVDYATLLAPLPYTEPNQLVWVWSKINDGHNSVSAGDFTDWKRDSKIFQDIHAFTDADFNLATRDQPEVVPGSRATPGMATMMGYSFSLGRDLLPDEGQEGKDHVVLLTNRLWEKLGSDPKIVGKTLRLNDEPYTVVGVVAPGVADRETSQLTVPLAFKPEQINHDFHWLLVIGRLKPGVTIQQAQADLTSVAANVAKDYPRSNKGWGAAVDPLRNDIISSDRTATLWLLLGAVAFILLIACVNVANLLLARSMARQKELAIRGALGATPRAIFTQLLTESLLLAVVGGALGIGVGFAMLRGIMAAMPERTLPMEADVRLNLPVLAFTLLATTVAGLLFGCVPAWYASRVDPSEALKEGGRSGTSVARHRLRRALVIGEFALALALLAGAGLTIHSFMNLARVDLGIRTDHILTFSLPIPDTRPKDPEHITAYYRQILGAIQAVPGVERASALTGLPLYGNAFGMPFTVVGKPAFTDPSQRPSAAFGMVTPEFFQTFGVRLIKGRTFTDHDNASAVRVAVVNEEFVNRILKDSDTLQQRISVEQLVPGVTKLGEAVEWQIVGVYHNISQYGLRRERPEILVPFWQSPWPSANLGVATSGDPNLMLKTISAAVHSVDPLIALSNPLSMEDVHDRVMANDRFTLILFGIFAVIALLLAAIGIYGVMSFSVAQRSHEIAVRMALGSSQGRVLSLILREGVILACIGSCLGLVGAYFVGRAMKSILFGVQAIDFTTFLAVVVILLAAAIIASYIPARRAASIQPMNALRSE
jgi:putative ABC transport system permease protein